MAHAPAAFATGAVALAVASIRQALIGSLPVVALFAIEVAVAGLALALFIRFSPKMALRRNQLRLTSAGVLGDAGNLRWRLAQLVLGRPEPGATAMTGLLMLGLGMLVVSTIGLVLIEALIRRADFGATLILAVTVLYAVLVDRVPALMLPGGIRVEPYDVVIDLILGAAILRLLRMRRSVPSSAALCWSGSCCFSPSCGERWRSGSAAAWPSSGCISPSSAARSMSPPSHRLLP